MHTSFVENRNTSYAYACIHDFFDDFNLSSSLQDMESILKAAIDTFTWKKDTPSCLLHFMENLDALITAAFVIYYSNDTKNGAILAIAENEAVDILLRKDYLSTDHFSRVWNNFPRSLSAKQYHNPYRSIKKFCSFRSEREWKKIIRELTEYALDNNSIYDISPSYNILTLRLRLLQLIEACHLLFIRVIKNIVPGPEM